MKTVRLYGHLAKAFGRLHKLDVHTPAEAVRALCANFQGFQQHVIAHNLPGYRVLVGKEPRDESGLHHGGQSDFISIVPVVSGAGGSFGKILAGAALIGLSMWLPGVSTLGTTLLWGSTTVGSLLGTIGFSLLLGGVSQMLFSPSKKSSSSDYEAADNKPSYNFNGAVNTVSQGNAVPLCYGLVTCGSQVISSGLSTEDIAI